MPQLHVFWGGRETGRSWGPECRNLRLDRGGSMRQLRLRAAVAGAAAAALALGGWAMLPAGANRAADGSVSVAKVQRGYDINVAGDGALVLSQRGKTLELASGSPFTLPAGCKAKRPTGQWHTAA